MNVFYCDHHPHNLPNGHTFPAEKYRLLRMALIDEGIIPLENLHPSPAAAREVICLAHTPPYYEDVLDGTLTDHHIRQIGLTWSRELVERAHYSIGGLIAAADCALTEKIAGTLSGGTHHAFANEGRGFCVFNDTAVAVLHLIKEKKADRIAVIDLDAHQGNGTAAILNGLDQVFILDLHGSKNYPVRKVPTDLDIALPEFCGDECYLHHLMEGLPHIFSFNPDIIFFIAGVDPIKEDRFGKLSMSLDGLFRRDEYVLRSCKEQNIPVVLSMGGGYAVPIDLTVKAHVNTYRAAGKIFATLPDSVS